MLNIVCKLAHADLKPTQGHDSDAGWDVKADIEEKMILRPGHRMRISTGLKLQLPPDISAVVRPRSGLSLQGLHVYHGTIDPGYRGIIQVVVQNMNREHDIEIAPRARIAQLVFQPVIRVEVEQGLIIEESTDRGEEGFGSTGI